MHKPPIEYTPYFLAFLHVLHNSHIGYFHLVYLIIYLHIISVHLFTSFHYHIFTSQPIIRSLPAAHHEEVCDYQSSVGSYRSQYITILSSFTDAFLPSLLNNTSIRQSSHRLCYRRYLIAGMFPSEATTATSQCLSRR